MSRKLVSLIFALLMIFSISGIFACSDKDTSGTDTSESEELYSTGTSTEEVTEETTAQPEVTTAPPAAVTEQNDSGYIFEDYSEYHYATFKCPYTDGNGVVGGGTEGGYFEVADDEMAAFIAKNPEWYKDTALMESWDTVEAPFGNCISTIGADTDFINDPVNTNGLMVYKTFEIKNLDADMSYTLSLFYDNTVYLYINGKLFFYADANCGSGDWNGSYETIAYNADDQKLTLKDFLVAGTNYIACSIKNCWGGRELDMMLEYEKSSTKASTVFFEQGTEWNYSVFACPYTDGDGVIDGEASGGYYEEADDMMAKFIADNPGFTTDTATLSAWPAASAPFSAVMNDIGWTGSSHGLILYKAFSVSDLAKVKKADYFDLYCAYDNAIHVYLNGTEIYADDGECSVQDWNNGLTHYELDTATIAPLLKDGENYFVVTIKDAWGGREFNAGFSAEWN